MTKENKAMEIKCPFCKSSNYTMDYFLYRAYNCKCLDCGKYFSAIFTDTGITYLPEDSRATAKTWIQRKELAENKRCKQK